MLNQYKQAAIILTVVLIIILGTVNYVKDLIGQPPESAPEHLQVKAPAEKILHSQKIKDEQGNDVVKYLYASETEVTAETIKIDEREIKEDISKRTKNAQFFKKRGLHSPEGLWSQDADTQEGSTASLRSDYGANGEANGSTAPVAAEDNEAVAANESEREVWVGRFYAGEPFYKDAGNNKWYQTETATTTAEEFSKQTKPGFLARIKSFFGMNALADTENYYAGTGDGHVYKSNVNWDTTHDGVEGSGAYYTGVYEEIGSRWLGYSVNSFNITRAFLPFNTSGLDDDAEILSAILKLYVYSVGNGDDDGYDWINVVQTSQADTASLVLEDYDQCGAINNPTEGSTRKDLTTDFTLNAYNTFELNAIALNWIKKTVADSYTLLGLREGHDALDHPIKNGLPGDYIIYNNFIDFYTSERTGTSQDPYLEVTYTVPAAPAKFRFDGGQMKIKGKVKFE